MIRPYRSLFLLILISVIALSPALAIILRGDFQTVETQYQNGNLDTVTDLLPKLKPSSEEERAFLMYYSAITKSSAAECLNLHDSNAGKYPATLYGQKSRLELAKNAILDHDFKTADKHLKAINSPELSERFYWLSVAAFDQESWQEAINQAENYIRLNPDKAMTEAAHYMIANSYIKQKKSTSAISTLTKLSGISGYPTDVQLYNFTLGTAYDKAGNLSDAISKYRTAYELNKFTQLAYQIEDRLFELRSKNSSLDISFLYPYSELVIQLPQDSSPTESKPAPVVDPSLPMKTSGRPTGGYYLQAGRFSVENNAISRTKDILTFNHPAVYFEEKQNNKLTWVVMSGPYTNQSDADQVRIQLISSNIDCFTVKY